MKIKSINIINGKNKWSESKDKLIHMILDLGEFEEKPSNKIEGFYKRIKEYLPSLQSHRCSEGKPGGFFKRIKDGTWMGHIIEHVALELQTLAGMNTGWGRTRGVKGQKGVYNVVFNYENKDSGKLAARESFNVVNDIINDRNPQIDKIVKKLKPKNLKESIRRVLKETLESKWNKGNYNYQHGYCHYFAYDIIGKIKKRFPNKKVNYYMILANEVDKYDGAIVQDYLIHVYIQIDNMLLDSNGITTHDKAWEMAEEWEQRQDHLVPDEYETKMWEEESDTIPEMFFNNSFCNTRRVKKDVEEFLNNEIVQRILRDK
jgi:hypothetical protein